jgi:hypothetical protein
MTKGTLKPQRFITAIDMKNPEFTESLSKELWKRIYEEVSMDGISSSTKYVGPPPSTLFLLFIGPLPPSFCLLDPYPLPFVY